VARIKESSVAEVKSAADIVEVVSARTSLRRASSARFTGRCPFHEERTPSFSVNPVEKFYYCFGCGAKGDVITFVRETEQLDFAGAVEWLADRMHVLVPEPEAEPGVDQFRVGRGDHRIVRRPACGDPGRGGSAVEVAGELGLRGGMTGRLDPHVRPPDLVERHAEDVAGDLAVAEPHDS